MITEKLIRIKELLNTVLLSSSEQQAVLFQQAIAADSSLTALMQSLMHTEISAEQESFLTMEYWQELEALFHAALQRETQQRAAFLDEACAGNTVLRQRIDALLRADEEIAKGNFPISKIPGLPLGTNWGPYKILEQISAGGMGRIYKAEDQRLKRFVAIKVLSEHLEKNTEALRRFEQEARVLAALSHPNIVTIFDFGSDQQLCFVVMEWLQGETLRSLLQRTKLNCQEVIDLALQALEGLSTAHSKGIVHRDLKPENIFITAEKRCKILDFGLARLVQLQETDQNDTTITSTEPGRLMGTVPYMSPEQVRGKPAETRSDLFSFGCILYEMISGTRPFQGENATEIAAAILKDEARPLSNQGGQIPPGLEYSVQRCLKKDPQERFQSVEQLCSALKSLESYQGVPIVAHVPKTRSRKAWHAWIILAVLVSVAGFVFRPNFVQDSKLRSIAVLPFANVGGDPEMEYLSDGITETLINDLSEFSQINVVARTSVMQYKGKRLDPTQIGRELKADVILTGKITQHAEYLIVQADLIDVTRKTQLWGDQYKRTYPEILSVQRSISEQIVNSLRLKLTREEGKRSERHYSVDPEAYRLYLKGQYHLNKRTAESMNKALEFFQRSIDLDPSYASSYCGLATLYISLGSYHVLAPSEAFPKGRAASMKALEIDPDLAEAHATLGTILFSYYWNWDAAEKEFQHAIQLNSNDLYTHLRYSEFLALMGRSNEAIEMAKRVFDSDPLSLNGLGTLALIYARGKNYDKAREMIGQMMDLDRQSFLAHLDLGLINAWSGNFNDAVGNFQKALEFSGDLPPVKALLGYTLGRSGQPAKAQEILSALQQKSATAFVSAFDLALVQIGLGNKEEAVDLLEMAYEERAGFLLTVRADPPFDELRSGARFQRFLAKFQFPAK